MFTFSHSGTMGDILYSLYFCKEYSEYFKNDKFNFNIRTNIHEDNLTKLGHPFKNVRMTKAAAEYMLPLLKAQPYINEITFSDMDIQDSFNLDKFRDLKLNLSSGNIQAWYYNLVPEHLPGNFQEPVITAGKNGKYSDKILICLTNRYLNTNINYRKLREFKDSLVFIGLEEEYNRFSEKYFNIPFQKTETMLELAEYMNGAKGFIGNQSGIYTLAECMKIPRILIAPDYIIYDETRSMRGPHNNLPQGGWCEDVSKTEKMICSLKGMLKL